MGRIEKIKRELIEEANKRILGEQEVQHGHHPHEDNIIIIDKRDNTKYILPHYSELATDGPRHEVPENLKKKFPEILFTYSWSTDHRVRGENGEEIWLTYPKFDEWEKYQREYPDIITEIPSTPGDFQRKSPQFMEIAQMLDNTLKGRTRNYNLNEQESTIRILTEQPNPNTYIITKAQPGDDGVYIQLKNDKDQIIDYGVLRSYQAQRIGLDKHTLINKKTNTPYLDEVSVSSFDIPEGYSLHMKGVEDSLGISSDINSGKVVLSLSDLPTAKHFN